jgi:hypothetical protein
MPALRLTLKPLCRPRKQPATTLPISPEKHFLFAAMAASIFLSSIFGAAHLLEPIPADLPGANHFDESRRFDACDGDPGTDFSLRSGFRRFFIHSRFPNAQQRCRQRFVLFGNFQSTGDLASFGFAPRFDRSSQICGNSCYVSFHSFHSKTAPIADTQILDTHSIQTKGRSFRFPWLSPIAPASPLCRRLSFGALFFHSCFSFRTFVVPL